MTYSNSVSLVKTFVTSDGLANLCWQRGWKIALFMDLSFKQVCIDIFIPINFEKPLLHIRLHNPQNERL